MLPASCQLDCLSSVPVPKDLALFFFVKLILYSGMRNATEASSTRLPFPLSFYHVALWHRPKHVVGDQRLTHVFFSRSNSLSREDVADIGDNLVVLSHIGRLAYTSDRHGPSPFSV